MEICQANDQLVPPIIIVELWPISVPSSTPRQTLPLSCKSPKKNMKATNHKGEIGLKILLGVLVNLRWWSSSSQEKLWMFLGSLTIFSWTAVARAWTVPSHHSQTWEMCDVELLTLHPKWSRNERCIKYSTEAITLPHWKIRFHAER
jgi:hypothetical protein